MKRKEQLDQLNGMSVEELKEQADALKESLFRLRFRKSLGVGDTLKDIRREKKTLARVYTLLNEKSAEKEASAA
ncbi:MAG: 50S ribosomal protein L29 [Acidobacteria bacterium]|nr:50S ribosomal protein L29 [Acidobacteriota bacterium]MCW5949305.1 50S ribosomal protein L29 [Pyrinomonadaceae bacterium]